MTYDKKTVDHIKGAMMDHDVRRDFFASSALQGLLANPEANNSPDLIPVAVALADALIQELEKQK